jgi:iron complex outermembrane recepter protein
MRFPIPSALVRIAFLVAAFGVSAFTGRAATVSGTVSNTATGKLLEGAIVEIPSLARSAMTDNTGRFVLSDVPPGRHELVASYTGLDRGRQVLAVGASGSATADFELSSTVYQLSEFVVAGDREGNAASITRQRNADSVKHVVSMDTFGNLANDNTGELLLRLPGIAGQHDLDGNISEVHVRGTPSNLNMVTVDGNLMGSNFSTSRSFAFRSISGALFDEIEVTKAPTPDMPADSIGGAINLKSASTLDMKGNRRVSYSASFRYAPRWVENVPMAHDHPLHPTLKLGWREVRSVFGGERNLGISINAFYSENSSGGHTGTNGYQATLDRRAYQYDFQSRDIYNNRKQKSVSLRFDYRLSPTTKVYLNALLNQDDQPYNRQITARATTSQSVAAIGANGQPTGTGAILPNYTSTFSEARALNASQMILTSITIGTTDNQALLNFGADHKFDRLQLDYNAAYSRSHSVLDTGEGGGREGGGNFALFLRNIGWTVDRSASEHYPVWTQTAGPSVSDARNYTADTLNRRNNTREVDIFSGKADAKYPLPMELPTALKSGFSLRRQEIRRRNNDRQWDPVSPAPGALASLVDLGAIETSFEERTGRQIPYIDAAQIVTDIRDNPTRWREDLYYGTTRQFIGNDSVSEDVLAGYFQGQVVLGKLKTLAGLRYERTEVDSSGFVASPVLSTTAQRNSDPVGAGIRDYNNRRHTAGSYDNWFPGVYLTYNLSKNLIARVNWSNSIGRPSFGSLVPSFSVNAATEVVTISNPGLEPQTSENWDAGLEYYFEPVGLLSANVFRKKMSGFIVSGLVGIIDSGANNGFGGDYAGYDLRTSTNGGDATIEGFELGYQQRFEFLPRPLSGLSAFANYTWLRTSGDYGNVSSTPPSTSDVVDFVPEAINVGLSYAYRGFGARVTWNRTGRYLNSYNANPALLRYTVQRDMLDASVSYRLRNALTVFADVRNITNAPRAWERAAGITTSYIFFTAVNFGVKGEF